MSPWLAFGDSECLAQVQIRRGLSGRNFCSRARSDRAEAFTTDPKTLMPGRRTRPHDSHMSITGAKPRARIHPRGAITEALLRVGQASATGCMRGSRQNTGARHQPGGYYLDSSQKIHCPWWMGASNSNNQTHTSVAASSPACGPGVGRCARHRRERMGNARPGRRGAGRRVPG